MNNFLQPDAIKLAEAVPFAGLPVGALFQAFHVISRKASDEGAVEVLAWDQTTGLWWRVDRPGKWCVAGQKVCPVLEPLDL